MSAFDIFIKASCITLDIFNLTDVVTLMCVSKHMKTELDSIYGCEKMFDKLIAKEYKAIGCVYTKELKEQSVLNEFLYLKNTSRVLRLYTEVLATKEKEKVFVQYLKETTLKNIQKVFIGFKEITLEQQISTTSALLELINSDFVEVRILGVYFLYYFLTRLYKHNDKLFLKDGFKCILGSSRLKKTISKKILNNITDIKDSTTIYPYIFIDKVLRMVMEMRRYLRNLR